MYRQNFHLKNCFLLCIVLSAASAWPASGQITQVTTVEDIVDFGGSQQMGDLPGPDGRVSFREAIIATNNTPGAQKINFAIPPSEYWLLDDVALLKLEHGAFAVTDDGTFIDFTTQTAFAGDTNPNGWEVGGYGLEPNGWGVPFLFLLADNGVVKGLDQVFQRGYAVSVKGNNNRVSSCTISGPLHGGVVIEGTFGGEPAVANVIGGSGPGEGNVLSGGSWGLRVIGPALDNVVIGNTLFAPAAGIELIGAYDNDPINTRIGGPSPGERNIISGSGYYGEEGFPVGTQVSLVNARDTLIEGNYVGTTADGSRAERQIGPTGISVRDSSGTTIRDNLISGLLVEGVNHYAGQLFGLGISISGASDSTLIMGNRIGTDVSGEQPIPNLLGVRLARWLVGESPTNTFIGSTTRGDGNLIAFSLLDGIVVGGSTHGVRISGNSIHSNDGLGIELERATGSDGVTPNDRGDADDGGNGLQNYPTLNEARWNGDRVDVRGTLDSLPNQDYLLEFFASKASDPSGYGEGEELLGSLMVTTDASGYAFFATSLPLPSEHRGLITSTAARLVTSETSEFSAAVSVTSALSRPHKAK